MISISIWAQFILAAVVIIKTGSKLSFFADIISDRLRLSKVLIGMVLLGIVTSLPELVTTLTSSISLNSVDLALGNVLGSNNFNLMIIVVLDLLSRKDSIMSRTLSSRSHIASASSSLILMVIVGMSLLLKNQVGTFRIGNIGIDSVLIIIVYIGSIKLLSKSKVSAGEVFKNELDNSSTNGVRLSYAVRGFVIAAFFVIVSGIWLANIGDKIVDSTGWGQTFVGSIFLAAATSFPELVVSIAALRLNSVDMAFGNIFGSNMFNLVIIPINDIAYQKGAILSMALGNHILTVGLGVVLTLIVIAGLRIKKNKAVLKLGWDTMLMLLCYLIGNYILFQSR